MPCALFCALWYFVLCPILCCSILCPLLYFALHITIYPEPIHYFVPLVLCTIVVHQLLCTICELLYSAFVLFVPCFDPSFVPCTIHAVHK